MRLCGHAPRRVEMLDHQVRALRRLRDGVPSEDLEQSEFIERCTEALDQALGQMRQARQWVR